MRRGCSGPLPAVALAGLLLLGGCGAAASATRDDPSIATHVKIALLNDPQLGGLRLDARTGQRIVTLSGSVPSQADADRAMAIARRVAGVKDVRSELKIGAH
jgi:hyperosmotically inducible protein